MENIELGLLWLLITIACAVPVCWAFWKLAFTAHKKWLRVVSHVLMIILVIAYIAAFINDTLYHFDTLVTASNLVAIAISAFFYFKYRKQQPL